MSRAPTKPARRTSRGPSGPSRVRLERKILLGFVAGVVVGVAARAPGMGAFAALCSYARAGRHVFIRLLTMIIVPLDRREPLRRRRVARRRAPLGRIGGKTLACFLGSTLVAAVIGLGVALAAHLGGGFDCQLATRADAVRQRARRGGARGADARADADRHDARESVRGGGAGRHLLPLIVAVCIFGAAATVVDSRAASEPSCASSTASTSSRWSSIRWLMRLAPAACSSLIAATVAKSGLELLDQLSRSTARWWSVALLVHVVVVLVPVCASERAVGSANFSARRSATLCCSRSRRRRRASRCP